MPEGTAAMSGPEAGTALAQAQRIGRDVAARHAEAVDRQARFPAEAVAALREARLLSVLVPQALGGAGLGIEALAALCSALGQHCAATGMVFAMHQIQVACLVRHGLGARYFDDYCRELVARQMLIASVTSEAGVGGDTRRSRCAVAIEGEGFKLEKDATTISYGAHADDLLITGRRAPDAPEGDQVLVLARHGDYRLEPTGRWDTLGMRGTCSPGFRLSCQGDAAQIVPGSFGEACSQTMVPYSHILWSALWLGLATAAVSRAAAFVRTEARRSPGSPPVSAARLAQASLLLQQLRSCVQQAAADYADVQARPDGQQALVGLGQALKMNHLKIGCSTRAMEIVHQALLVCGIAGYKNDGEFSLGRILRDVHSAELMIGNDRIAAQSAALLLVHKDEPGA